MEIRIRPAQVDDAAVACAVQRRSIIELCTADHNDDQQFLSAWLENKTAANVATWIADPGNIFYVATDGDDIVGVAAMTRAGQVNLNYVSPDARFKGISKALLRALEHDAAKLGLTRCTLASTKTALQFYHSAGYRKEDGGSKWGTPMSKNIAPLSGATTR